MKSKVVRSLMPDPGILIAGREWPVPLLAPRQNRIVVPALLSIGKDATREYELLLDIVFAALTRAHPDLNRDDFEDWPLPLCELREAVPVIARQTGLLKSPQSAISARGTTEPPDWDAIIAQFVNFLPGTTPDYWEDALTWSRFEAMREEWRQHPPVAALVAGFLGYKPRPRDFDAVDELMRLFPDGKIRLN